ncbi:MAG TPA: c-type cytochrome [Arenimonas sp.]|uniref:c-type cytochrome n=1 Tax=Arenimonas sp. TaxID=1872635 RepID=UPI002D7F5EE3|nr:c-type cytochrome [Arenimonas sp.]HEU0152145.1 c-type cytochrome [Arenimonas sp.]
MSLTFPMRALLLAAVVLSPAPGLAQARSAQLSPEQSEAAAARYQQYCALCHGPDRAGHANDHAPSLKSPSLIATGTPVVIGEAIAYGRPGTPMGAYHVEMGGPLTRQEIRELAFWLMDMAPTDPIPVADRVEGDLALGAEVYAQHCASCHGAEGEGGTGTALGNATMLALTPDGFLRHAIENGREGTPMVAFKDVLGPAQIDGVTAFLRSRSAGWAVPAPRLHQPPALDAYVINPDAAAPEFTLTDGLYVSAAELDRELKARKRMVLLDTRVTSMWERAHIEGAVPGPYYASREEVMANLPTDGTWIVAYCECPRAAAESVVRRLREAGVPNTAVLWEGIQGWVSLGYPVVQGRAAVATSP